MLINHELFWQDYEKHSDFDRLLGVFRQLDFSELVELVEQKRKRSGRRDWPAEAMLRACYAMIVLQHRSVESFRRELGRNPTLMKVLGFDLKASKQSCAGGEFAPYRVPSSAAFCRFNSLLMEVEGETGALKALFYTERDRLGESLPDFGARIGFDGKSIRSHSSGQKSAERIDPDTGEMMTSDPDADWGVHDQYYTDADGREKKKKKIWFGFNLHVLGDVVHELPLDFRLTEASGSEHPACRALVSDFLASDLSARTKSFVADRGLDGNGIREILFKRDVLPVIDTRNLWQTENLDAEQLKVPTRALNENVVDTLLRDECGNLYCKCPASRQIRPLCYKGYEKKRGAVKWVCPAAEYDFQCAGRDECFSLGGVAADAASRVVRMKLDPKHLRNCGALPPSTLKWKRLYRERSAMERLNSRLAESFLMHDHCIRGKKRMELRITLSMTVMLAAANFAIESGQPKQIRSLVKPLKAA